MLRIHVVAINYLQENKDNNYYTKGKKRETNNGKKEDNFKKRVTSHNAGLSLIDS